MSNWGFLFNSWFSSTSQNNDTFINAILDNLIDSENIPSHLYRASNRKYFDSEKYPMPKMAYSPIWFSLNAESVNFYARTYNKKSTKLEDEIIFFEYQLMPSYKILKIRNDDNSLNEELMKIIVDHIINKIKNDGNKMTNIINKLISNDKYKYLTHDEIEKNILNDSEIINKITNVFKGIYKNERTNDKFIDELLFQEIINEMMHLNIVERYNVVGFWNGYTMNESPDPTPEEIIIIANRMRECLTPILSEDEIEIQEKNKNPKRVNIIKTQEEKIRRKEEKNKNKTKRNLMVTRIETENNEIGGGKKYKKNKNKTNKKSKNKKIKNKK